MKKVILFLILTCITSYCINAQSTGAFQLVVPHNSNQRTIEYYVPTTYNAANNYPMVVGLHGCVGGANPAAFFRNDLQFLSDSIGAIIVCPNGLFFTGGIMDNPDHTMILTAIDTTIGRYNIDTNEVYLTGFSCNGYVTAKHGTQELYNWAGIIPFNAAFAANYFTNGSFDFTTQKPICVCIGTADPGLTLNNRFRDSLVDNNITHLYNTMPGVGHATNFPTFKNEIMECFNWMDTLNPITVDINLTNQNINFDVFPNPVENVLNIKKHQKMEVEVIIYNMMGKLVLQEKFSNYNISINTSRFENGTYNIQLRTRDTIIGNKKFIIIK